MIPIIVKLLEVVLGILVLYIIILFLFYLFQNKFLFLPKKISTASFLSIDSTVETIKIRIKDSDYLRGWLCNKQNREKQKVIIYFGGNGDEVSYLVPQSKQILNWSILLVNYPGYGHSDGKPSENIFFESALKIYDYIVTRNDIDKNNIVIMGRSIGTSVATFLASKRKNKGVILVSPFTSMTKVVNEKFLYLFPINLILKSKFDSKEYAKKVTSPLLCIYGSNDKIIPMRHSKALIKYWGGKVKSNELIGFNHNNLIGSIKLWNSINEFLIKLDK